MATFIIFCILFSFISLFGIGFWFYFIINCIPSWIREIKYNLDLESYFSAYFTFIAGLMISTFIIAGIPCIMYQVWGPFMEDVYKTSVDKPTHSEPPTKVIQYEVPQEIRVDSDFIHNDNVIHRESN